MINEGEGGEEGDLGGLASGEGTGELDQPGVIQVSPQDKEAIERVRLGFPKILNSNHALFTVESTWFPRESCCSGILCL